MALTTAEIQAKIDKLDINMDRLNAFTNGDETTTVAVDNAVVPSIAKFINDLGANLDDITLGLNIKLNTVATNTRDYSLLSAVPDINGHLFLNTYVGGAKQPKDGQAYTVINGGTTIRFSEIPPIGTKLYVESATTQGTTVVELSEYNFDTKAAASAANISSTIHSIETRGANTLGDGLGGIYIDVNTGSSDTFTSADGRIWYKNKDINFSRLGKDISSSSNVLFTVGSLGDFTTLNEAINAASKLVNRAYINKGFNVEIRLLSGFVMAEQVTINKLDLSWITLTSVNPTVTVNEAAITETLLPLDAVTPFILGTNYAKLPLINVLFTYNSSLTAKDGIAVTHGASVHFQCSDSTSATPVSGVKNARRGLVVLYGAEAICAVPGVIQGGGGSGAGLSVGPDFSGCSNRAIQGQHGAKIVMPKVNISNCSGDNALYVIWNSFADVYQANMTGHSGANAACHARDGSIICARESDASNAAVSGYHALHAATIDARSTKANNCGSYGYLCTGACNMDATAGSAINAGNRGVWSAGGSSIEFESGVATGCAGTCGVGATGGGSTVNAAFSNVSNCVNSGYFAENGATINAASGNANNCLNGINTNGAIVTAPDITATGCRNDAVLCQRASMVNVRSGILTGATVFGVECLEASTVNAQSANTSSAGTSGYRVIRGGQINANGATGTLSKTANTIDANGIIYQ